MPGRRHVLSSHRATDNAAGRQQRRNAARDFPASLRIRRLARVHSANVGDKPEAAGLGEERIGIELLDIVHARRPDPRSTMIAPAAAGTPVV